MAYCPITLYFIQSSILITEEKYMSAFLTVIVPVYKVKEEYLRRCLNSLCMQTVPEFNVILIDDGSPDQCGAICDEFSEKDKRFFVIHQENSGVSAARNAGILAAETDWIVFVDADDWTEPQFAETLYRACSASDADIYIYDYYNELPGKSVKRKLKQQSGLLDETWKTALRTAPFHFLKMNGKKLAYASHAVWNKMFRRSLLQDHRILFETSAKRGEDSLFLIEALQCTEKIYYIDTALYHYRRCRESATNITDENVSGENELVFQCKSDLIQKYRLSSDYQDALFANICTRLYSSMRLWYFSGENPCSRSMVRKEILKTLNREPYKTAFYKVKYKMLSPEQKIFVFLLKHKKIYAVQILVQLRRKLKGMG